MGYVEVVKELEGAKYISVPQESDRSGWLVNLIELGQWLVTSKIDAFRM